MHEQGGERRKDGRRDGAWPSWLRRRLPFMLFLLSIGLAGYGAFEAMRAMNSHQATAEGLLSDYGAFASWSFNRAIHESFYNSLTEHFRPVYRARAARVRDAAAPTPADLADHADRLVANNPQVPTCGCSTFFGSPYFFRMTLDGSARYELAGTPPDPAVMKWLRESLPTHADSTYRSNWPFAFLNAHIGERPVHIAYTVLYRRRGPDLVYGMEVVPERARPIFEKVLLTCSLLPAALTDGRDNDDLLAVEVVDPDGALMFASVAEQGSELFSSDEMDDMYGGLTVKAAVRPAIAGDLIIGGLPRSRMPFLLGIFGLGTALALMALGQLRREEELGLMRSDFVASVSHELRTPLAQIRLFLETLRLGRLKTEAQREWSLDNIDRETQRLVNLVENVLHFSRAERGTMSSEREAVDAKHEVAHIVDTFRPLARSRRASIENRVPESLGISVHRDSFRQVMINLLDNAVKYGPAGQTVRVTGTRVDGHVRIAVEDQGPGVAPKERETIFEPYRRGDSAVGTVAVGSGIGLSVVQRIIEHHGGRVWVEDAADAGARFVIELPALPVRAGDPAAPHDDARRPAASAAERARAAREARAEVA